MATETAQEFIERYLRELTEYLQNSRQDVISLHQKFFSEDHFKRIQDWRVTNNYTPESVEFAEVSATSAKITTIRSYGNMQQRQRYHLAFSAGNWKITDQELECIACHGTRQINRAACPHCKGVGWTHMFRKRDLSPDF